MKLGGSEIEVVSVGVGTWAWGDRGDWGFGRSHDEADLREAFLASAEKGPILLDTAEKYALGESERFVGRFLRETGQRVVVATKFSPTRWQLRRSDLLRALRGSLERLGLDRVDLYQLHWPTRFSSVDSRMAALADAVEEGLVRAVGVSNFSAEQLLRAHDALARRGIPLATQQVEFSLLHRNPEEDGVTSACAQRGVTLVAYSPLAMGMLSGKYTDGAPLQGWRSERYPPEFLARLRPLLGLLREIGQAHGGRTRAQVALAWVRGRGALPIPGAKNRKQAEENLGALDFDLSADEMAALARSADAVSARAVR